MTAESVDAETEEAEGAAPGVAGEKARRAILEGLAAAERGLADAAALADRLLRDSLDTIRSRTGGYSGPASETFEDAQRYLVERIKDRPVTATFAGLGIGLLIGVLISSRGK